MKKIGNKYESYNHQLYDSKRECADADFLYYKCCIVSDPDIKFPMVEYYEDVKIDKVHLRDETDAECMKDALSYGGYYDEGRMEFYDSVLRVNSYPMDVYLLITDAFCELYLAEDVEKKIINIYDTYCLRDGSDLKLEFEGFKIGDVIEDYDGNKYTVVAINARLDRTLLVQNGKQNYIGAWALQYSEKEKHWYWCQGHYFGKELESAVRYVYGD